MFEKHLFIEALDRLIRSLRINNLQAEVGKDFSNAIENSAPRSDLRSLSPFIKLVLPSSAGHRRHPAR